MKVVIFTEKDEQCAPIQKIVEQIKYSLFKKYNSRIVSSTVKTSLEGRISLKEMVEETNIIRNLDNTFFIFYGETLDDIKYVDTKGLNYIAFFKKGREHICNYSDAVLVGGVHDKKIKLFITSTMEKIYERSILEIQKA